MSVQLYGHWVGDGSFARVSRAIAWALRRKHVNGHLYGIHNVNSIYENVPFPIGMQSLSAVGVYIDYPENALGWLAGHKQKVLVTVCESNKIPQVWVEVCNKMDLIVVPSRYCERVFQTCGVKAQIMVVPHGVDFESPANQVGYVNHDKDVDHVTGDTRGTSVKLLHISGAASFPERKGTLQLILAFRRIVKDFPYAHLYIKMPFRENVKNKLEQFQNVHTLPYTRYTPDLANFYRGFDAVVQPSRGEGFGMVPLEARCAGVPVALTNATGHKDHFVAGIDVPVSVGPATPLSTQGNTLGSCPEVTIEAVETALRDLLSNLSEYKKRVRNWANENSHGWQWSFKMLPLAKKLAYMSNEFEKLRPGAEAGLRG